MFAAVLGNSTLRFMRKRVQSCTVRWSYGRPGSWGQQRPKTYLHSSARSGTKAPRTREAVRFGPRPLQHPDPLRDQLG